jgi:hypothetical protein
MFEEGRREAISNLFAGDWRRLLGLCLVGKGGHVRAVPMPLCMKSAVDRWMSAANVTTERTFRTISRHGTAWGKGISEDVIWYVVRRCAERMRLGSSSFP